VRIERTFAASAEDVFEALTSPEVGAVVARVAFA
jgi:uncharacterized protein YndB with AHSA1/START domain